MKNLNRIHFLEGYWQDCIILESNGHFALIDTGVIDNYNVIKNYLLSLDIKILDFIIITHFHRDHYGNLKNIVEDFKVKKVYLKSYSGMDKFTAYGTLADDNYRESEKNKFNDIVNSVSNLELIDDNLNELDFHDFKLIIYNNTNNIKNIYEDRKSLEYNQFTYNENINSIMVLLQVKNKNILLGGDLISIDSQDSRTDNLPNKIAKKIGREIDLYKINHHASIGTKTIMPSLNIYKPKKAVITNSYDYSLNKSKILELLKASNPSVDIYYTSETLVFNIDNEITKL